MTAKSTTSGFIEKARQVHGDLYDYSEVKYVGSHTKITIICPQHGKFEQTPANHLRGQGHPKRAAERLNSTRRVTQDDFIKRAKVVHGDLYDYSKVQYQSLNTKVLIIDPVHGEFMQTPAAHLAGCGNPKRAVSGPKKLTTPDFIKRAKEVHGDFYDYSKVDYKGTTTKVLIIDREHGEFWQTPANHLQGCGCPARR